MSDVYEAKKSLAQLCNELRDAYNESCTFEMSWYKDVGFTARIILKNESGERSTTATGADARETVNLLRERLAAATLALVTRQAECLSRHTAALRALYGSAARLPS